MTIFILLLLNGYAAITAFMFFKQRSFLYFPTPELTHPYERFSLSNQGESLEVIVINPGNRRALLYFGGNGESVALNADIFSAAYTNTTLYLLNYRGYGGSSGSPSEDAIYSDAIALYDHIAGQYDDIFLMGRSLGSGVATYLAANRLITGIVLVTPYDSILNIAKQNYPLLPVGLLLKDRYESALRAKNLDTDILVLIAEFDEIIPRQNTDRLIDSFTQRRVTTRVFSNTSHNTVSNHPEYHQTIQSFLDPHHKL
ncbi:MAG: lysophospholipase [Acidiferrobacterales bacterium]|nr:lysophospholipase [Acidiferrobacterales bacterium]